MMKTPSMCSLRGILSLSAALLMASASFGAVQLRPKLTPNEPDRRAREQLTLPDHCREMPFVETAPEPAPSKEESRRGYLLFHRPITEPVHSNTRPLESERLRGGLNAFATPGEWEPVTLSVYPLRDLKDFRSASGGLCQMGIVTWTMSWRTTRTRRRCSPV